MSRRVLLVAFITIAFTCFWAPDLSRVFGHPLGEIGVSVASDGRVASVAPNASAAGVRVGDVVDWQAMSVRDRFLVGIAERTLSPGMPVRIALLRSGRVVVVRLVTVAEPADAVRWAAIRCFFSIVFTLLGVLVLLRRPSAATWAFFAYALGAASPPVNVINLIGPMWLMFATSYLELVLTGTNWALVFFAILLLHDGALPRWRRVALAGTGALELLFCFAVAVSFVAYIRGEPSTAASWVYNTLLVLPLFLAAAVLMATSSESSPAIRPRLRWVIAGTVIGAIANGIAFGSTQFGLGLYAMTYAQYSLALIVAALAVGTTVAYAILKHRIVDVNVALSRALVYTLISAMVVGVFALVELFFTHAFSESRAGLFADIGLALILGFFFNSMHARVDQLVDGLLFRSRHLAERHLETVIHSMPYARSGDHVDRLLIDEPVRAFSLAPASLVRAIGGSIDCGLERADSLVAYLEAERRALHLSEHGYACEWAVAIGVFSHGTLAAVAFYSPHRDATGLDGDEVALLERLADAAGTAYDRLEAEALRRRVAVLEGQMGIASSPGA